MTLISRQLLKQMQGHEITPYMITPSLVRELVQIINFCEHTAVAFYLKHQTSTFGMIAPNASQLILCYGPE